MKSHEFIRYALVSGIAWIVDLLVLHYSYECLCLNELIAAGAGFLFGLVVNYILCVIWVFRVRRRLGALSDLTVFAIIGILGLFVNEIIIWIATPVLGIYAAKVASTGVVFFENYQLRKSMIFK